jgi:aspartyl/asparaginyl beta-hydroxylase (cupin superfamily)
MHYQMAHVKIVVLVAVLVASSEALYAPNQSKRAMLSRTPAAKATEFGDRVEAGLQSIFEPSEVTRVVDAWRRMRSNKMLNRAIHTTAEGPSPMMMQQCNSYLEGLEPIQCFHDNVEGGSWVQALEQGWVAVRAELRGVLASKAKLAQGSNVWVGPLAGDAVGAAYGDQWKTLGLYDRAEWDEANVALFPNTCALLRRSGVPLVEALFARMGPGSAIKPHSDLSNFVLTAHLGVDVPAGACWIQVRGRRRLLGSAGA